jgi:hypothetical protein
MKRLGLLAAALLACSSEDHSDDGQGRWVAYHLIRAEPDDSVIVVDEDVVLDIGSNITTFEATKTKPNHSVRAIREGNSVDLELLDGEIVKTRLHCGPSNGAFQGKAASATMEDGTQYQLEVWAGRRAVCDSA